jgi:3-hydroxyacyl-CoA dehydrogenase
MSPRIDRVAVVGCGLIGSGWASGFLAKGLEVTCTDQHAVLRRDYRARGERSGLDPGKHA